MFFSWKLILQISLPSSAHKAQPNKAHLPLSVSSQLSPGTHRYLIQVLRTFSSASP